MLRLIKTLVFCLLPASVFAHAGQQGLILLLPTDIYITAGGLAIVLTILLATALNHRQLTRLFTPSQTLPSPRKHTILPSLLSTAALAATIWLGLFGPHDPLASLMTLGLWTVLWIAFTLVCGLFGNLWAWLNPWTGLFTLLAPNPEPPFRLPPQIGHIPALLGFLAFSAFGIANPSATDPQLLAIIATLYWMFTFMMMMLFGPETWLQRGEFLTVFFRLIAKIAPFKRTDNISFGTPGWRITAVKTPPLTLALFSIALLATGTFDGFNETFFWLAQIGINPLAFPGRSAIIPETVTGILAANLLLPFFFYACIRITTPREHRRDMFARQSLTILPIALAYHFAHFLPSLMVDVQYTLKALTDPLNSGADILRLGQFYVTTGFFNTTATVRIIFLTQAGAIVLGHILAILLSHRIAADYFTTRRAIILSQIPLSLFMIAYTVLGLWLLATPKGA